MLVDEVLKRLKSIYADASSGLNFNDPYETLVATILSAQCTDRQVNKVTPRVFAAYPTLAEMTKADEENLFNMVKSCGFKSKARNIINACKMIQANYQGIVPNTLESLTKLPGVGRKTANVIIAFAYGQPAIPVDTHVFRVANRLGLACSNTPEKTEKQLKLNIPQEDWSQVHIYLINHGRVLCKAGRPLCDICFLSDQCNYCQSQLITASPVNDSNNA